MSVDKQGNTSAPSSGNESLGATVSRRTLLRRSLRVVPPAVVTLASAPVSAGICLNASGFVSGPTFASRHPNMGENCAGLSPSTWASDSSTWPADFAGPSGTQALVKGDLVGLGSGTKFNAIFDPDLTTDNSLRVVLAGYTSMPATLTTLAAAVVALWLNASTNRTGGVFTVADAVAIWQNINTNGGYKPSPTSPVWSFQQTQDWLGLTWGQPLPV